MGFLKDLFGGKSGPSNPYAPVDFAKLFAEDLQAPGEQYDYQGAYQDLFDLIGAPSGIEEVLQDVEGQQMQDLLSDIDINTKQARGSSLSDFVDRGLTGAGRSSDIAENALAQIESGGARAKSGVQTQYALGRLGRLTQKEQAAQGAQGDYANLLAQFAQSANQMNLQRLLGLSGIQSGAFSNAAQLANTSTPGIIEDFARSFSKSYGQKVGENTAGPSVEDFMKSFAMGG